MTILSLLETMLTTTARAICTHLFAEVVHRLLEATLANWPPLTCELLALFLAAALIECVSLGLEHMLGVRRKK